MTEELLTRPYWVIDFLPEQVPEGSPGQFFAVEGWYLRQPAAGGLRRRFAEIRLKLNCYDELLAGSPEEDRLTENPAPEALVSLVLAEAQDLCFLLPGQNALITLNRGDTYMTVYNPGENLLRRLERLAAAEGLFLRQPGQTETEEHHEA